MTNLRIVEINGSWGVLLRTDIVKAMRENPTKMLLGVVTAEENGGVIPIQGDVGFSLEGEGILLHLVRPRAFIVEEDSEIGDNLGFVIGFADAVDVDKVGVVVLSIFAGSCCLTLSSE